MSSSYIFLPKIFLIFIYIYIYIFVYLSIYSTCFFLSICHFYVTQFLFLGDIQFKRRRLRQRSNRQRSGSHPSAVDQPATQARHDVTVAAAVGGHDQRHVERSFTRSFNDWRHRLRPVTVFLARPVAAGHPVAVNFAGCGWAPCWDPAGTGQGGDAGRPTAPDQVQQSGKFNTF